MTYSNVPVKTHIDNAFYINCKDNLTVVTKNNKEIFVYGNYEQANFYEPLIIQNLKEDQIEIQIH